MKRHLKILASLLLLGCGSSTFAAASAPNGCTGDIMGNLNKKDVAACEAYASDPALSPRERATAYVNIGHALRYTAYPDGAAKAIEAWTKSTEADPSFAEPLVLMSGAELETTRPDMAFQHLQQALALDPKHWRALVGVSNIYMLVDQRDEAVAWARKAVAVAPDVRLTHQYLAKALVAAGQYEEALHEYERAAKGFDRAAAELPGMVQEGSPWPELAQLRNKLGFPRWAISTMSQVIDGKPDYAIEASDLTWRAKFLEAAGEYAKAADDLDRAVKIFGPGYPTNEQLLAHAAMLRAKGGDTQVAGDSFRDMLRQGKPQTILRIQVFLKNSGFDVAIDGKVSPKLQAALDSCLEKKGCIEAFGQPI